MLKLSKKLIFYFNDLKNYLFQKIKYNKKYLYIANLDDIKKHEKNFYENKIKLRNTSLIRNTEKILGGVIHSPSESSGISLKGRSSIYVVEDIRKGETLSKENLKVIRPGFSLHPKFYEQILGKKLNKDLIKGSRINFDDILKG